MKRAVVFLAGVIVALGTGAVIAQSDPIATRKALMKENNDNARALVKMMRGQVPFDPAQIDAAFAQWADTAQKFPGLFPENSKTGGKTRASPKIWVNKKDFDAKGRRLRQSRGGKPRQSENVGRRAEGGDPGGRQGLRQLPRGLPRVEAIDASASSMRYRRRCLSRRRFDSCMTATGCRGTPMIKKDFVGGRRCRRAGACGVLVPDHSRRRCRRARCLPIRPISPTARRCIYAGGCASCHAVPKQPDKTKLGGGLALNSPFGTFYVPNISSDPKDGIGAWSEAQFVTAMNKGTSPAGEHYYPAFPYTSYQRMTFRRPARSVRLSQDAAAGGRAGCAITICRFRSISGARSAAGSCCSSTASRSSPIRRNRRNGTAAPIWSTAPATARNVTRRATFRRGDRRACASPAGRAPTARAAFPTSPSSSSRTGRKPTSLACSRTA